MQLSSPAFKHGGVIPTRHTGDAADISPPLQWTDVPPGAAELALIVDDPDAPTDEPWVHWVIYGIAAEQEGLPEGVERAMEPAIVPGAKQGRNTWDRDNIGYRGPAPPRGHGVHHYRFRLYALDRPLSLPSGATKKQLLDAMRRAKVLAEVELVGTYKR